MLMVMFVNHYMAVMIVFMNRSVGRRMTIIMFFEMTPALLIPSTAIVRRFPVSVALVMFGADMLRPDLTMMPVFCAIRLGSTCK